MPLVYNWGSLFFSDGFLSQIPLPHHRVLTLMTSKLCFLFCGGFSPFTNILLKSPPLPSSHLPTPGSLPWLHPTFVVLQRFITIHKHSVEVFPLSSPPLPFLPFSPLHSIISGLYLKGSRMGSSDKVSLWYVPLLINTRFRFLYFRISNC